MKGNITFFFCKKFLSFMLDFFAGKAYNIIKRYTLPGAVTPAKRIIKGGL